MLSGLTGGGGDGSGIGSILSGLGGLNKDHELVRHVQQNAGIQDPEQARQYTQHGVDILMSNLTIMLRDFNLYLVDFWEEEAVNRVVAAVAVLEICLAFEESHISYFY